MISLIGAFLEKPAVLLDLCTQERHPSRHTTSGQQVSWINTQHSGNCHVHSYSSNALQS
jgi:hypothetical protein